MSFAVARALFYKTEKYPVKFKIAIVIGTVKCKIVYICTSVDAFPDETAFEESFFCVVGVLGAVVERNVVDMCVDPGVYLVVNGLDVVAMVDVVA